jgi:hypothetical protein
MELFVRSESVVSRLIAGETLIVPISKGVGDLASIYSLNSVASLVWDAVAEPCTVRQIADRIAQKFDGVGEEVEQDVKAFLTEMESVGLVRHTGAATAA